MAYTRVSPGVYQDENGNQVRPPSGRMPSQGLMSKPPAARPKQPMQQPQGVPRGVPQGWQGGQAMHPMQYLPGQMPQQQPGAQGWQNIGPAYKQGFGPQQPQRPTSWQQQHDQEMGLSKFGTNFNPAQNSASNAVMPSQGGQAGMPRMPMGMGQGSIGFNPNAGMQSNAVMPSNMNMSAPPPGSIAWQQMQMQKR